ncbi:MAG: mobilization protein [Chitinophagaceae bacterium]|nr:MAG: mobilization protein [Chitinophagaceae bacterium]
MMENEDENRSRILLTRLKPAEFKLLDNRFKKTRFRKLSEYIRSVLLEKPVTVMYRDKSMDEVLEELILLRKDLNSIGNNLNQTVRNINAAHGQADSRLWINLLGVINSKLEPSIGQIKERMNNYAELWSRKLRAEEA